MKSELKVGDDAPDFEIQTEKGNGKLSDYRGRPVVLYFYPKDDTPGCTIEACNFRDNFDDFKSRGIEVIGVSVDNDKSHKKFVEKYSLNFLLVPDRAKEITKKYNVLGMAFAKRVTFITYFPHFPKSISLNFPNGSSAPPENVFPPSVQ